MQHFRTAWHNIVQAKMQLFIAINAAPDEIDVPLLENQALRVNDVTTLLSLIRGAVDKLQLLALPNRPFNLTQRCGVCLAIISSFVKVNTECAAALFHYLLLLRR